MMLDGVNHEQKHVDPLFFCSRPFPGSRQVHKTTPISMRTVPFDYQLRDIVDVHATRDPSLSVCRSVSVLVCLSPSGGQRLKRFSNT